MLPPTFRCDFIRLPAPAWHYILYQLTMVLLVGVSQGADLFRSSPGGDRSLHAAGLWGGEINTADDGLSDDLYAVGFDRIAINNATRVGLDIVGVSYDPITRDVLLEIQKDAQSATIARGSLCQPTAGLRAVADGVRLTSSYNPYLVDDECAWKCGWNAFAFHDGRLYFLLSAVFGDHISSLTREIQVRVLTSACSTPVTSGSFDILACSEKVVVLHSESYLYPTPTLDVWAAGAMVAVREHQQDPLRLFVQLFNKTTSGVFMNLIQISYHDGQATVLPLHGTLVENIVYHGRWRVRGLGEIAYRDGLLCWTAAEELHCGNLDESGLTGVTRMLQSGEAYGRGICTGSLDPYPLGHVLTGVAIASAFDPVEIYFGCYSEEPGIGGLGLLKLSSLYTGLRRHLVAVQSDGQRVFGGALFLIDDLQSQCHSSPVTTPVPCGNTTPCACGSRSAATHLGSQTANIALCIVFLLLTMREMFT